MNIKVQWCENKTAKTGKPYKKLSVETESGDKADVNIFSNFPDFANISPGYVIIGELTQEGQYWNITPEGAKTTGFKPRSPSRTVDMTKMMDKKDASIEKFQTSKEESIKLAGAQRDAVLIVNTLLQTGKDDGMKTHEGIKEQIIHWRNWFLSDDFTKDIPPF